MADASAIATQIQQSTGKESPTLLTTSGWQAVNIGDIASRRG
jgi:hypothetical protein